MQRTMYRSKRSRASSTRALLGPCSSLSHCDFISQQTVQSLFQTATFPHGTETTHQINLLLLCHIVESFPSIFTQHIQPHMPTSIQAALCATCHLVHDLLSPHITHLTFNLPNKIPYRDLYLTHPCVRHLDVYSSHYPCHQFLDHIQLILVHTPRLLYQLHSLRLAFTNISSDSAIPTLAKSLNTITSHCKSLQTLELHFHDFQVVLDVRQSTHAPAAMTFPKQWASLISPPWLPQVAPPSNTRAAACPTLHPSLPLQRNITCLKPLHCIASCAPSCTYPKPSSQSSHPRYHPRQSLPPACRPVQQQIIPISTPAPASNSRCSTLQHLDTLFYGHQSATNASLLLSSASLHHLTHLIIHTRRLITPTDPELLALRSSTVCFHSLKSLVIFEGVHPRVAGALLEATSRSPCLTSLVYHGPKYPKLMFTSTGDEEDEEDEEDDTESSMGGCDVLTLISRHPHLQNLEVCSMTQSKWQMLAALTNLQQLRLLGYESMQSFDWVDQLTGLTDLEISMKGGVIDSVKWPRIAAAGRLKRLVVGCPILDPTGLAALQSVTQLSAEVMVQSGWQKLTSVHHVRQPSRSCQTQSRVPNSTVPSAGSSCHSSGAPSALSESSDTQQLQSCLRAA